MVLLLLFWVGDSCYALQIALLVFHCLLLLRHSIKSSEDLKSASSQGKVVSFILTDGMNRDADGRWYTASGCQDKNPHF